MKDAYTSAFYEVVQETKVRSGYELPEQLEAYVVMLLAHHMDRPDFLPESSFAETYLKLSRPVDYSAKELGDTCLFVTGVFPKYGAHRGLNRKYYSSIGIGSYEMVSEVMHKDLFSSLAKHFEFLSEFIEVAVCQNSKSAATINRSSWL
jgi:hypothetical protein